MERPLVEQTAQYKDIVKRGIGRAEQLPRRLGVSADALGAARILEVGCGYGDHCSALQKLYSAQVIGVDPWPRIEQGPFAGGDFYRRMDICSEQALELGKFDYICSYDVLEHVEKPRMALQNIFELLAPGGRAYLKYNLHRGASASHLVKYLDFPWVHLLHDEGGIRRMMLEKTGKERGPAWVNRLTYAHYLQYFTEIGFEQLKVWYSVVKMPVDFYAQHEHKLKAYPREDLERNFMHVTLQRPL